MQSVNRHGRHVLDAGDHFDLFGCMSCNAVFVAGLNIDADYYARYYPQTYYDEAERTGLVGRFLEILNKSSIRAKERYIRRRRKSATIGAKIGILDIGCGVGSFLEHLDNRLFEKTGVEINPLGAARCRAKGIKVFEGDVRYLDERSAFDVITMWHVVEHLDAPAETMRAVYRLLKADGLAIVATGNTRSWGFRMGKARWFHLDSPRHLILYDSNSIKTLGSIAGLRLRDTVNTFYDYPLDLFWSLRNSWLKFVIYPLYPLSKLISQETLMYVFEKTP